MENLSRNDPYDDALWLIEEHNLELALVQLLRVPREYTVLAIEGKGGAKVVAVRSSTRSIHVSAAGQTITQPATREGISTAHSLLLLLLSSIEPQRRYVRTQPATSLNHRPNRLFK